MRVILFLLRLLLNKPEQQPLAGILELLDVFGSSYVTGIIFYILVEYIPEKKQEKKFTKLILPSAKAICRYSSDLLLYFNEAKNRGNIKYYPGSDIDGQSGTFAIEDKNIFLVDKNNPEIPNMNRKISLINQFNFCLENINKNVAFIMNNPNSLRIDSEILYWLEIIKDNDFFVETNEAIKYA